MEKAQNNKLTKEDFEMLALSGISKETAAAYGVRRVTNLEAASMLGRTPNANTNYAGLAFPIYSSAETKTPNEHGIRLDEPEKERRGDKIVVKAKYLIPPGRGGLILLPKEISSELLNDVEIPVIFCEGFKKFLALVEKSTFGLGTNDKLRFIPVGILGVYNWRGTVGNFVNADGSKTKIKGLLAALRNINLKHRQSIILFDNDIHTNINVKIAAQRFAETLQIETEAIVYFCDLPRSAEKLGIDDLIGTWTKENGEKAALDNLLELLGKKRRFSNKIQSFLLGERNLLLNISASERGKCEVSATFGGEPLAMDIFHLADATKRGKFVKDINILFPMSDEEKAEVLKELMLFASVSEHLTQTEKTEKKSGDFIETGFQILKDGRVIEQIRGGFGVYDAATGKHSIETEVSDNDGTIYKPIEDELFQKSGGVQLADDLVEYESDAALILDIEFYLSRYLDLKPLFLRLTALYILFTYISDQVLELSYLNATGDPGSGKSRFGFTVSLAARRGLSLVTASTASIFRIVDKFAPTLFIDEFNSDASSDDAAAIIQILCAGFQQGAQIPRQVPTSDGKYKTEMFNAYCPKVIGSLKQTASNALNSRCIEIQMERTARQDIPLRLSLKYLRDAQEIRNKLTLWRLHNVQNNFEARLDEAEKELKENGIMPRSIQINIPLFALINDDELKESFIELLKSRDQILTNEKQNTIDGEIVQALHAILFDVEEIGGKDVVKWKIPEIPQDGKICEHLRAEKVVSMLNDTRKDKDHLNEKYIGRKFASFGLHGKQIKKRTSDYYNKSALFFDSHRLAVIFKNYGFPVPSDFSLDSLDQDEKSNSDNDLTWSNEISDEAKAEPSLDQVKHNHFNNNAKWSNESKEFSPKGVITEKVLLVDEVF